MMRVAAPLVLLACRVAGLGGAKVVFKGRRLTSLDAVKPPKSRRAFAGAVGQATLAVSSVATLSALGALAPVQSAGASYAPSSAAVTSAPPANRLGLNELGKLSKEKLRQREGSLSSSSVDNLLEELKDDIKRLRSRATSDDELKDGEPAAAKPELSLEAELAKQAEYEFELKERAAILGKLEAQPAWFNYAAAAGASIVSTVIMHPLDTVKTKLMAGQDDVKFDTSLYQGLLGNIFKEAPSSALYLGVYEVVKTFLLATPQLGPYPILVYLIGGAAGEFFGSIIRAPAEAVKSMTQSGMCEDTGAAVRIVLEDVPTQQRIQRAWSSSLLRDVPMGAIQIAIFEGLKVAILNSPDVEFDVNTLQAEAALGGFGGFIAALVTTPMDVVTTRIITSEGGEGIRAMIQEILEEGGPIGLMRGAGSRALYWAPAIGIFLSCYCIIRQYAATSLFQV